ncbi:alpha/beta hydrolase [Oceaniferula marina]|nr:alpha/beta fold hydrolase [Oceaniferula marina]
MKRRFFKPLLIGLCLVFLSAISFTAYLGRQLASPERRELQDYHQQWIQQQAQHSIHIQDGLLVNEQIPYLLVTPSTNAPLSERARIIREQVQQHEITLPAIGEVTGTVVLLHGRNGRKEDLLPVAERFCALGLRCLIPDLPAHGESPVETVQFGLAELEQDLPRELLIECAKHHQFNPEPSALWGISMGGCFATRSAANNKQPQWQSLVIVSSFDRLDTVIKHQSHSSILNDWVSYFSELSNGADPAKVTPAVWAQSVSIPVLVAHGSDDALIPMSSGRKLYDSFPSNDKKWIEVPGGDHDNVLITPMPLYAEMGVWILKHLSPPQQEPEASSAP